jgi:hypothetical protein
MCNLVCFGGGFFCRASVLLGRTSLEILIASSTSLSFGTGDEKTSSLIDCLLDSREPLGFCLIKRHLPRSNPSTLPQKSNRMEAISKGAPS